jgi:hypothetical protein
MYRVRFVCYYGAIDKFPYRPKIIYSCKRKFYAGLCKGLVITQIFFSWKNHPPKCPPRRTDREKIAPKNNSFYQELIGLSGTFAIPEKRGLIIDKTRALNDEGARPDWRSDTMIRCINSSGRTSQEKLDQRF